MSKVTDALNSIVKDIESMSVEEINKKFFCLNGVMTKSLFNKVINEIIAKTSVDSESLFYNKDEYKINQQEFMDVFHYIEKVMETKEVQEYFETYECFFNYKGNSFKWDLMIGQGSIETITCVDKSDYKEIEVDESIRFFKR